jgi:hypothetical protein
MSQEANASLPKPQAIIVPPFVDKEPGIVNPGTFLFRTISFPLTPSLPVPVGYQWQIVSAYLPTLVTPKSKQMKNPKNYCWKVKHP